MILRMKYRTEYEGLKRGVDKLLCIEDSKGQFGSKIYKNKFYKYILYDDFDCKICVELDDNDRDSDWFKAFKFKTLQEIRSERIDLYLK